MKKAILLSIITVSLFTGTASADTFAEGTANEFNIDFVLISGSTNPISSYGNVNNDYRMGTYEITNDQWTKFTNSLSVPVTGNPSSAYDENPQWTRPNVPTNEVSLYEAAQFVNWLNTSSGHQAAYNFTGTQGQSDYTMSVWDVTQADGTNLYRNSNAYYFLPTEDEWAKAAYWNGTRLQFYSNASAGDLISGSPDPAKWNYGPSAGNEPWDVGSGSEELNGTFDMMGNVWEWMESPYHSGDYSSSSMRVLRSGSYVSYGHTLSANSGYRDNPYFESHPVGFRVASVPEPCTLLLVGIGSVMMRMRKRK